MPKSHPTRTARLTLLSRHLELHLRDRHGRVKPLGACSCAVEDGVAAVHAQVILHLLLALLLVAVLFIAEQACQFTPRCKTKPEKGDALSNQPSIDKPA